MYIKKLPCVNYDVILMKAIDIITKFNYGIVIALNKNKKLLGVFTDGDLRRTLKIHNDIVSLYLYKVMTKKPITIDKDMMAVEAMNIMEKKEITSLVVLNKDKTFAGLLTLNELLRTGIE